MTTDVGDVLSLEADLTEAVGAAELLLAAIRRAAKDAPQDFVLPEGVKPRNAAERRKAHDDLAKQAKQVLRDLRASCSGWSVIYYCGVLSAEVLDLLHATRDSLQRELNAGLKRVLAAAEEGESS